MLILEGPTRSVADALEMSMTTGSYEPRLIFSRLEMCFIAWDQFDDEGRDLVAQQVRHAWKESPDSLVKLAKEKRAIQIVLNGLSYIADDLNAFRAKLASP